MNSQQMFKSLVKNAIDFLQHSIIEIDKNPKYSIIHFFAAIELFLKARLMLEHWALIYLNPKEANLQDFNNGKFYSVGMDEAINRLKNIAGIHFSDEEYKSYNEIKIHRNKLVHFYLPNYEENVNSEVIQNVVSEECKAWLSLHRLLTRRCKKEFKDFLEEINKLNLSMHHQRAYLKVKYDNIKNDIQKGKSRGIEFRECESCGFEAAKVDLSNEPLIEIQCLVCKARNKFLNVKCPNCNNNICVYEFGNGICSKCGEEIDINYLLDQFGTHQAPKDFMVQPDHAFCSECEYIEKSTVVPFGENYLCLACLSIHNSVNNCQWCNELVTGDLSDSYLLGCFMCDGMAMKDD